MRPDHRGYWAHSWLIVELIFINKKRVLHQKTDFNQILDSRPCSPYRTKAAGLLLFSLLTISVKNYEKSQHGAMFSIWLSIILLETSLLRIPRGCANSVKATMFMKSPSKGLELSATEAE